MAQSNQTAQVKDPYQTLSRLLDGLTEKEFQHEEMLWSFYDTHKKNLQFNRTEESLLDAFLAQINKPQTICQDIITQIVDRSNDKPDDNIPSKEETLRVKMGIKPNPASAPNKIKRERVLAVLADYLEKANAEASIVLSNTYNKDINETFENDKMTNILAEMKTDEKPLVLAPSSSGPSFEDRDLKAKTQRIARFTNVRNYITSLFNNKDFGATAEAKKMLMYDFGKIPLEKNVPSIVAETNPVERDFDVITTPINIPNKYSYGSYETKRTIEVGDILAHLPEEGKKVMYLCCGSQFLGGMENGLLNNDTELNFRTTLSGTIETNSLFYPLRYGMFLFAPSVLLLTDKEGRQLPAEQMRRLRVLIYHNIRQPTLKIDGTTVEPKRIQNLHKFDSVLLEPAVKLESINVANKIRTSFQNILEFALFFGCDEVITDDFGCYDNLLPVHQIFQIFDEVFNEFRGRFAAVRTFVRPELSPVAK